MTDSQEDEFRPYATAIGFMLRSWNDMQAALEKLFCTLLRSVGHGPALAIWHAVPNDRFQRRMLKDLANSAFNSPGFVERDPAKNVHLAIWNEIEWIVDSADRLGAARDAATHSPVAPVAPLGSEPVEFITHHLHGNPSAQKLKGKKLLAEFELYQERADVISRHAIAMEIYLRNGKHHSLPERPPWPERQQKRKDAKSNPTTPTK